MAGALIDSMRLLMLEHAGRIAFQEKTRRELSGPFFADYRNSLRIPKTWNDGDEWPVNYVGHPIHGAAAGFIWIQHRPDGRPSTSRPRRMEEPRDRRRLDRRLQPAVRVRPAQRGVDRQRRVESRDHWLGRSRRHAGRRHGVHRGRGRADRYLVIRVEHWTSNAVIRRIVRVALNPSRSLSNMTQGRMPWFRATRPLR